MEISCTDNSNVLLWILISRYYKVWNISEADNHRLLRNLILVMAVL